ncbi:MAG: SMC-Scp complex subunit ScpB [Eubacterium sp.]
MASIVQARYLILSKKGLIEEKGRLDLPGRPLVYGTTDRFLRCFSLNSLDDLPDLPEEKSRTILKPRFLRMKKAKNLISPMRKLLKRGLNNNESISYNCCCFGSNHYCNSISFGYHHSCL